MRHTVFKNFNNNRLELALDKTHSALFTQTLQQQLSLELSVLLGNIEIIFSIETLTTESFAKQKAKKINQQHQQHQKDYLADPMVQKITQLFGATVDVNSIKPHKK